VRWRHNENCLKFDGTVDGLVKTMESALDWSPGSVPDMTVDPPYWTKPANCVPAVAEAVADRRVSIVVTGCVSPEAVNESVTALSRAIAEHDDVCFLLPSSGFDQDDNSCRLIRRHGWNFRLLAGDARNPEQIQASLLDQQSDIIVLLPAAYRLHPRFTQSARLAMSRNDKLAIFTTHVREMVGSPGTPVGVRVYAGDLASAAMSLDCIVPGAVVFRRSVFNDYAFDLRAREAWFDEFTRRLCLAGEEVLVAPCVQLDLQGSKVEQTNPQLLSAALADEYVRTLGGHVRMLAFDGKQGPSQSEAASNSASRQIDPDALRLAWPEEKDSRQSVLVGESAGASGLPITLAEATVLCASLGNCYEGGRLILDISAAEDGNAAEVAVAAMAHIPDSTGLQSLLTDAIHDDIALTGWRLVESGQRMSIELAVPPLEGDHGVVILMFRPASGAVAVSTRVFIAGMSLEPLQYG
jgi:hypothetical protein